MKIEQIAKLCHEVNRAYCESIGEYSQSSWEDAPEWQKQSAINGVEFHLNNDPTPKDSHDNWMRQKLSEGWIYGEEKDPEAKTHPCLVEYQQLSQEQRSKDYIFKGICDFFKRL